VDHRKVATDCEITFGGVDREVGRRLRKTDSQQHNTDIQTDEFNVLQRFRKSSNVSTVPSPLLRGIPTFNAKRQTRQMQNNNRNFLLLRFFPFWSILGNFSPVSTSSGWWHRWIHSFSLLFQRRSRRQGEVRDVPQPSSRSRISPFIFVTWPHFPLLRREIFVDFSWLEVNGKHVDDPLRASTNINDWQATTQSKSN
jgi:hypothetical protein